MNWVAIRMLTGDRVKFLGLVFGIAFSTLLITQQLTIFVNLLLRGASAVHDVSTANVWVMDPVGRTPDVTLPMPATALARVRSVPGVAYAIPMLRSGATIRTAEGNIEGVTIVGLDDATLIGLPRQMIEGTREALSAPDAVFIDGVGAAKLFKKKTGLSGTAFEINDRRAVITGVVDSNPTFTSGVTLFTRYSSALRYVPGTRNRMSFVLVQTDAGRDPLAVAKVIEQQTGLRARTSHQQHRHSDQLWNHRGAWNDCRRGHRRPNIQPVYPRQHQTVWRTESHRRHQRQDPSDGCLAVSPGGTHRLWHRRFSGHIVHQCELWF
jgi:putative ABC transport system permease protein